MNDVTPPLSQTDVVVHGIKDMITSGKLGPGARLPVEKDLATQLGVSRGSLREGVRALCIMGVLETRQGDGSYVTSLDASLLLAPMAFLVDMQTPEGTLQLQSVRRVLESEAASRAAGSMSDEQLAEAEAVLSGVEAIVLADEPTDHLAVMEADIAFHRVIARGAGNPALEALIEALASRTVRARLWRAINEEGVERATHAEHRAILRALTARDADGARLRMATHLLAVEDFLATQPKPGDEASGAQAGTATEAQ
ncbi:DNA-binding FadR family transcriptional regulator [Compostimonas suwonensis]|uniref:DNA-binding FadR family transcriptional regulator n=1 Tax=Compostimonas suwonensis TaxID=1048394 RepID=A0A2M9C4I6_9MICO|nr:DNA-binding FadR family transcriptional regulator [Compostimonas suwonensis]